MELLSALAKGDLWDGVVDLIIRPPRLVYQAAALGPPSFRADTYQVVRRDFTVTNPRNLTLQCSLWEVDSKQPTPCVIYLHGNAASRLSAESAVRLLCPFGICVCAFDFSGCGPSEGRYVSLGHHEQHDIGAVVEYLRSTATISTISLWGHSMGAASAFMYCHKDPSIAAMVLDSPFSSLQDVASDLAQTALGGASSVGLPLVNAAMTAVAKTCQKKAGFDLRKVTPLALAKEVFVPTLFAHGDRDDFIRPVHSQRLFDAFNGDKEMVLLEGADHNSPRSEYFHHRCTTFLISAMQHDLAVTQAQPASFRMGGGQFVMGNDATTDDVQAALTVARGAGEDAGYEDDEDEQLRLALAASLLTEAADKGLEPSDDDEMLRIAIQMSLEPKKEM